MAAPVYDNSINAWSASNVASLTSVSFAVGGTNRFMVGFISSGAGSPADPSGMKWGGSGGTALTKQGTTLTFDTYFKHSCYTLLNPTAQTSTLYGNWPSNQDETTMACVSVTGVDQTTPMGTIATNTGTSEAVSVNATTVADDFVVDGLWVGTTGGTLSRTLTVGANQTARQVVDGANPSIYETFGCSTEVATGTSTTMSWTISGTGGVGGWGIFAVPLKPASSVESYSGSASLSGVGSASTSGAKSGSSGILVDGSGAIASVVAKGGIGVASLSGSGSLSTSGTTTESRSGSVSVSGSGSIAASGVKAGGSAALLDGSGSLSTGQAKSASGSASLSGSGSVSASGLRSGVETGLDFPSNPDVADGDTVRFKFTDPHTNGLPIYGASGAGVTYIWRYKPRQQTGFYTTFFWANDDGAGDISTFNWDGGGANTYYGAHPYPPGGAGGTTHEWEISADAVDTTNGTVVKDVWYTQAFRAWGDINANKEHEFYWDLPNVDSGHKVTHQSPTWSSNTNPPAPALTFGDAPWQPGKEMCSGILRGLQIYSTLLTEEEILAEIAEPLSTVNGAANIWYLNLNPTPDDISDKSGNGNHPAWVGPLRPTLYSTVVVGTSLSGSGSVDTTGSKAASGSVALGGSGSIATSGTKSASADVAVSGSGSLSTSGTTTESHSGSASISGSGSIATTGTKSAAGSTVLTGSGDMVVGVKKMATGSTTLSGSGVVVSEGLKSASSTAALSGSGSIFTIATTGESHSGSVAITGQGQVSAEGQKGSQAAVAITGQGQLEALGIKQVGGIVSISGGGFVSLSALKAVSGFVTISGSGSISINEDYLIEQTNLIGRVLAQGLSGPSVSGDLLTGASVRQEALI